MTKINKLFFHGFKSFAKPTEIVFGDDFNCVLGPNGSGKSNILDALCFVLGRGSSKSLRAEKSANLIYNGGKTKKPMKQGEVSIFFDNSQKTFPTVDKEVKVTRIVKSNGQSVYKINNKTMTRQQVLDLLAVAKINPDGSNIILQGDVIRFVDMSSIERRKIIEEISGISIYEEKKNKALNDLNKVDERLKEAEIILAERQTYLKELKKERDYAQKYKDLSERVNVNKASYLYIRKEKKEKEKGELDGKIEELKTKFDKTEADIHACKAIIADKKKKIQDINKEIEEKGEKEQIAVHKRVEALKVDLATSKAKIENSKNEISRVQQRKDQLSSEQADNNNRLEDIKKELVNFEKDKNKYLKEQAIIDAQLKKFKQKNALDSASDIDKQIEDLDRTAEKIQTEVQTIRERQQSLLREKDRIEFQMSSFDEKIKKVHEVAKVHKDQIEKLKAYKQDFRKAVLDLNQVLNEDSSLAVQSSNARKKLLSSQEELSKLVSRNLAVKERVGGNVAIKTIIEQRNKIKGIHGTVSDLGKVQSKYSLALEIASGARIQSIVVDNDKVAAECIKYLKDNKLGVATFIPLNKIKAPTISPQTSKLKGADGVHDLAINLVSFDSKFQKVFQHVFGDTLVVDNINVARRIGVGLARMVTIDGDLAEKSGVMRGGFRHRKAAMGFQEKEVTRDIFDKEKTITELKKTIDILEKRKTENESKIGKLREFKANLEGDIIKLEKSLHLDSDDTDVSREHKEQLKLDLAKTDSELEKIQVRIGDLNKDLATNKIKKAELRGKINQLRNPTVIAELNAFNEKKQELRDGIIRMDSETKNIKAQFDMIISEKNKIQDIVKQHDKEIEKFSFDINKLTQQVENIAKELHEKEKKEKEFYSKFKALFNKREAVNTNVQKQENRIEGMRELSRTSEIKMNTISLEHAKIVAELAGIVKEFEQYEGVKIDKSKSEDELNREINKFEAMVSNMDAVNMKALEIYESVEKEYTSLLSKKDTLFSEKESVLEMINEIEGKKTDLFMNTFEVVNKNFRHFFNSLSTKGEASLVIENPDDIFEEGLRVMVRITGNKFMDIRSLSGGEKTMTALAFIFAIQEHEPHSFYILDEVDAALDKHNSEKLAKLVRQYCEKAQYIVISHNDCVISEADNLYGVSMNEHGITNITSLKL